MSENNNTPPNPNLPKGVERAYETAESAMCTTMKTIDLVISSLRNADKLGAREIPWGGRVGAWKDNLSINCQERVRCAEQAQIVLMALLPVLKNVAKSINTAAYAKIYDFSPFDRASEQSSIR